MPKYIVLGKFTSQGIMHIKDSPKRLKDGGKLMRARTQGYDIFLEISRYSRDFISIILAY